MSNPYFRFKQFTVWHDRCAMKVGTDGTLLGAWANVHDRRRILDVGTGTGLIALMLAQRNLEARIDGIDLDADACLQAQENVRQSPFATRIRVVHAPLQSFASTVTEPYDLIVSNPPYFRESMKCPEGRRSLARHDDSLTLTDLLHTGKSLLAPDGRIALILPFAQRDDLLRTAKNEALHKVRETYVIPVEGAAPKRLLIELSSMPSPVSTTDELTLENRMHQRTIAYRQLTQVFYLF
ncbi:tRNA1(Val) (adenine(37)-N6)-methyltransferase [Tannerella sp.]|uniref:tRNA1(Val) (adenine(37)-N6)-methyltransferase n=1 Tax=Tannerella sp. TaxID=2382127 RepID=UPI0034A4AE7C